MAIHIVGAGVAGVMAALACRKIQSQEKIYVYEKAEDLFSFTSGKNAGIGRSYDADPVLSQLTKESLQAFANLPKEEEIIRLCGLHIDPLEIDYYEEEGNRSLQAIEKTIQYGGKKYQGQYIAANGVIDIDKFREYLRQKLIEKNIKLYFKQEISALRIKDAYICQLDRASGKNIPLSEQDIFINAAGSWAAKLINAAGLSSPPLLPHKRHLFKVALLAGVKEGGNYPVIWREKHDFYWVTHSDHLLVTHGDEVVSEPHDYERNEAQLKSFYQAAAYHLGQDVELLDWHACLRTFSLDKRPVIGFDQKIKNLFWVAGLGGHGMSLSLSLTNLIAHELQAEQVSNHAFSPGRFF